MGGASSVSGFNFTAQMEALCRHAVEHVEPLKHVDMDAVAVTYRQTRKAVLHGLQACLTPLRFENGAREMVRGRYRWTMPRIVGPSGWELLYILSFYLPRFLDRTYRDKLVTVFHELWHISPAFDGDLRRHEGRCYMHSARQADFDAQAEALVDEWLAANPPEELYDFLKLNFRELVALHGSVYGHKAALPKMVPVPR